MGTLDNLRKDAKRRLKALRAGDREAAARLRRAYPAAPAHPGLRDVQHALAREHGHESWIALTQALQRESAEPASPRPPEPVPQSPDERTSTFLAFACWDHHVHGKGDHRMHDRAAARLLAHDPGMARASLYTAVVCGERDEVERIIAERPEAANEPGGPRGWTPLLYLCYTRFTHQLVIENAVPIARALLDRGANPNDYYMAGDARYSALVGAASEGEQDSPRQPQGAALFQLLLERGAEPFDIQVLYNTHFSGDVLWWLELVHAQTMKSDRRSAWDDPDWPMLDMGGYGCGARFLLETAIKKKDVPLAGWLLSRGANPNALPARDPRWPKQSLYQVAVRQDVPAIADLLLRHGATRVEPVPGDVDRFLDACSAHDRDTAIRILAEHPEYLQSPDAIFAAARRDDAAAVALLLDLGEPIEIADRTKQRALHVAASHNALRVAQFLIGRGADIDPVESNWGGTPISFAAHHDHAEMIDLLSRHSRYLWTLAFRGYGDRVREVLEAEPQRAREVGHDGTTLLWWLPDDEARAMAITRLLLSHGADAAARNGNGNTAASWARKRGMLDVAGVLEAAARTTPSSSPQARAAAGMSLPQFEALAEDLLSACQTEATEAAHRLNAHFNSWLSADQIRDRARQHLDALPAGDKPDGDVALPHARLLIARLSGFRTWDALVTALKGDVPVPAHEVYAIDAAHNRIRPRRTLVAGDWDLLIGAATEGRVAAIDAWGQMNDARLERVSCLGDVTRLMLGGSRHVSDAGLQSLARMPQLEHLDLTGCDITDRGLEVLRHLPSLKWFTLLHHGGITDAGLAHLAACRQLERVDVMNTTTGDGTIRALAGMPRLSHLKCGNLVTADGVAMLHDLPVFKTWHGGEVFLELMSPDAGPNFLWLYLTTPHLDRAIARLDGLDGLFGLSLHGGSGPGPFSSSNVGERPADIRPLAALPGLGFLGLGGDLCDDDALRVMGSMPRLRMLMGQGATATDDGFEALARSESLEYLWGRECPNLTGRGFVALSRIPTLLGLAVSCHRVDDDALGTLPRFPSLRHLLPMDVHDEGFRHIGRCEALEALWCMYCRDTTDAATEHIAGLRLKSYYAGQTRITDRSLETLGRMTSLEQLKFWNVAGVTDAGLRFLAALPRLRDVELSGMPNVTLAGTGVFPPEVRVNLES